MILISAKLSQAKILKLSNEWQTDDDDVDIDMHFWWPCVGKSSLAKINTVQNVSPSNTHTQTRTHAPSPLRPRCNWHEILTRALWDNNMRVGNPRDVDDLWTGDTGGSGWANAKGQIFNGSFSINPLSNSLIFNDYDDQLKMYSDFGTAYNLTYMKKM